MTAICSLVTKVGPLVFGDLVVSGDESDKSDQTLLPTVGQITNVFPKGSGYSIVGTGQKKVCLLGENLLVAWADDFIGSKHVISEFTVVP